jgi:hypothetical protein
VRPELTAHAAAVALGLLVGPVPSALANKLTAADSTKALTNLRTVFNGATRAGPTNRPVPSPHKLTRPPNVALQSTGKERRVPSRPGTNVTRLVYFERFDYIRDAIGRENGIKRMLHAQKIAVIESMNPQWQDLSEE